MAIRFVEVQPGAPTPGEAAIEPEAPAPEVDHPPSDPPPAPEQAEGAVEDDLLPPEPASKPRARRKAAAPARRPAALSAEAPAEAEAPKVEVAPPLFPDLPVQMRPAAKARKNRRGFG